MPGHIQALLRPKTMRREVDVLVRMMFEECTRSPEVSEALQGP